MLELSRDELPTVDLPKWPAMTVQGESVTREQAAEILIRTNGWWLTCNDKPWNRTVYGALGVPMVDDYQYDFEAIRRISDALGFIDLSYLYNSQIMSAWIGGPHGWCDWGGRIETRNYNIGKWPSAFEVLCEWQTIAEAFPFLNLRCQLWSGETSEEATIPLVEYRVADGKAEAYLPRGRISEPTFELTTAVDAIWTRRERGCTEATLREALAIVRKKYEVK